MSADVFETREAQPDLQSIFSRVQDFQVDSCFKEIILVTEDIAVVVIHHYETIAFDFIEELEPPIVSDLRVVQNNWLFLVSISFHVKVLPHHLVVLLDVHAWSHLDHRIHNRSLKAHLVESEREDVWIVVHPTKHPHI